MAVSRISSGVAASMNCGSDVPLCGVLTLQSGYGTDAYHHSLPGVHGLWPETGAYGTSQCIAPEDATDPSSVYTCYALPDETEPLSFEIHEWDKHGVCAGVANEADYFNQICSLSAGPIKVMTDARAAQPGDFDAMKSALVSAGYPVWGETSQQEVMLSVCAREDGDWRLAKVEEFSSLCASLGPTPSPGPVPSPTPQGECIPNTHGPACQADADCEGVSGCVRCAHSGYCTDVPLALVV